MAGQPNSTARKVPATVQVGVATVVVGAVLFGCAGTWEWWQAWAFMAVYVATMASLYILVFNVSPELVAERATAGGKAPRWDRLLVAAMNACLPLSLVAAALDHRWGWTPELHPGWALGALLPVVAGNLLTLTAMRTNRFFSSHVRIQHDRGHAVVDQGPYAHVRHPGYSGALLFNCALPLLLGSAVAAVFGVVFLVACVVRTRLEDQLLQQDLPGYAAYSTRVRHRLVPGVW